jgi:hypothetical protein
MACLLLQRIIPDLRVVRQRGPIKGAPCFPGKTNDSGLIVETGFEIGLNVSGSANTFFVPVE